MVYCNDASAVLKAWRKNCGKATTRRRSSAKIIRADVSFPDGQVNIRRDALTRFSDPFIRYYMPDWDFLWLKSTNILRWKYFSPWLSWKQENNKVCVFSQPIFVMIKCRHIKLVSVDLYEFPTNMIMVFILFFMYNIICSQKF